MSIAFYRSTQLSTISPLSLEHMAFARVTAGLERCAAEQAAQSRDAPEELRRHIRLSQAVHANLRLWLTLAEDLARPQNLLPAELRQALLRLAAITQRHSRAVMAGKGQLRLLIDINRSIMAGLDRARGLLPAA